MGHDDRSTRQRLLDAGVDTVGDVYHRGPGAALGGVNVGDIAARAGVSRSSVYHHWGDSGDSSIDAYLEELAHRCAEHTLDPAELSIATLGAADLGALIADIAGVVHHDLDHDERRRRWRSALASTAAGADTGVRARIDGTAALLEGVGHRLGFTPRQPHTWADVATMLCALSDGERLHHLAIDDQHQRRARLDAYTVAMGAIVDAFFEPRRDDDSGAGHA